MDDFFERVLYNNDKLFKLIKVGGSNELLKEYLIKKDIYLLV